MKRILTFSVILLLAIPVVQSDIRGICGGTVKAEERSGEIIREIMNRIDHRMEDLEKRTTWLEQEKEDLMKDLKEKYNAFQKEKDEGKKESLKVDMLIINAKLNKQDIQEVEAYLETISDLVPDLKRLKQELKSGSSFYGLEEDFNLYRRKVGGFMTRAAGILARLKDTAPQEARRDIETLENNLIGIFRCWDSSINDPWVSLDHIDKTTKELEEAFAQLVVVRRLLEQENINLKIENFCAIANLTLIRLGKGKLGSGSFLERPVKMREGIAERAEIMRKVRREPTAFSVGGSNPKRLRSGGDEDILRRIRTGNYGW
ncbi:MAG TPA: hypothetical protein EYP21_02365 [Syntrophaceae bacterium]|nr:hypothetical protein [Syntrophaceae bacterium]